MDRIQNMKRVKAVTFDLDGLLLDTETVALETFVEACRANHFEPDTSVYCRCIGTTYSDVETILKTGYGADFPFDAVMALWNRRYAEEALHKPVPLKEGVLRLLRRLEMLGIRRAIVTSSKTVSAQRKLKNAGILDFFSVIVCGDQISKGKPDPEIYRTASEMLGEDPSVCLALEDSDNGVRSAIQAGFIVIQIPDLREPEEDVRRMGHSILKSLLDVEALFE
jgi:HAD superfamily hydrolase (TIGR01509 family)